MSKRPSPDSVICIDLTEDDDEREKNLGDVRKRLKGTPAAATAATVKMEGVARAKGSNADDDDDGGGKIGSCAALQQQEWASEVEVVEPVAPEIHVMASTQAASASDDVVLVGTANESRLPHMRQHCPENKFVQDVVCLNRKSHVTAAKRRELAEGKTGNATFCDLCFCFVCDKPAKECISWGSTMSASYMSHCHACDTGDDAAIWKGHRANAKHAREAQAAASVPAAPPVPPTQTQTATQHLFGRGPFAPDNALAVNHPHLTKCRKCDWYNRFDHRNFEKIRSDAKTGNAPDLHPVGFLDWCQSCGRVASERDFGKLQAQPYVLKPGDIFLGEKTIPFSIVAHDPRYFDKYQRNWTENEGPNWSFSKSEMEEDVFKHRLGQYPRLDMILASIPITSTKSIPKKGSLHMKKAYSGWERENYYGVLPPRKERASADETDAIIVEDQNDRNLLVELLNFGSIGCSSLGGPTRSVLLDGDITASWNTTEGTGTLKLRVFLQPAAFKTRDWKTGGYKQPSLSKFLGTWFGIFPFTLTELNGNVRAKDPKSTAARPQSIRVRYPPFAYTYKQQQEAQRNVAGKLKGLVKTRNKRVKSNLSKLSLSSGEGNLLGGTCLADIGLEGILKQYVTETFVEDLNRCLDSESVADLDPWATCLDVWGVRSCHRSMRKSDTPIVPKRGYRYGGTKGRETNFESYLRRGDYPLAMSCLRSDCRKVMRSTKTLKGVLDHLENLHHPSVPFVEGLTVELLEFQRQSVQWALERETTPGGVQSFLWAKLPTVAEPGQDIYYNPILERFRSTKPQLVRGGIIAEEMGLGKTVISLALILQNPAPAVPQSGSPITVLDNLNDSADVASAAERQTPWDKDLYSRTSASNSKRGSILSRGTLVVCHVSLVGQWIDEAKEKLSDPGLVYPYHGQSRKRNAATLAQNAIVVTTYQTLASDATYHANKAGDGYCAPCEQVRWWRIICDESHSLREASTKKSMAVMNLVADHKWLVSGTPVNTSLNDLHNQLKFIGIENVDEMFRIFSSTAFQHTNDRVRRNKTWRSGDNRVFGHFVFLLRSIMIRHTQKQTYRGTTTTLMSLPPKVEKTIEVKFSDEEKKDYAALDDAACKYYTEFKGEHGHKLSKYYLRLTQKLTPLRIAASGGRVPLDDEEEKEEASEEALDDSDEESVAPKKKKAKKEKRFSEFAYNSKINALVAELKRARDEDPHAKSLVFSQFSSTLKWLQQELPKHGFQYRTLSGDMTMRKRAKALHDFQHDPPTTIFLLSLRAGAVGINLTQANRVFLMEPSFNPAVEAQAIGRVHRLGQKRNVEVIRLVMKDSVETRILEMLKKKYGDADNDGKDAKPQQDQLIGSIQMDKTKVLAEEFDILYGVANGNASASASPMYDSDEDIIMEEVTSASV